MDSTKEVLDMTCGLFNDRQAAQVAAFFLVKAGGRLTIPKLIRLMYLAERKSLERYGEPLTNDDLVSTPGDPVLSKTLYHINGLLESSSNGWDDWISDRENREVCLANPSMIRSPKQDLTTLSAAELGILEEIWDEFGHLSAPQLQNYTLTHCAEWKDPHGSSIPIHYKDMFDAFNFPAEKTEFLVRQIEEQQYIDHVFQSLQ